MSSTLPVFLSMVTGYQGFSLLISSFLISCSYWVKHWLWSTLALRFSIYFIRARTSHLDFAVPVAWHSPAVPLLPCTSACCLPFPTLCPPHIPTAPSVARNSYLLLSAWLIYVYVYGYGYRYGYVYVSMCVYL